MSKAACTEPLIEPTCIKNTFPTVTETHVQGKQTMMRVTMILKKMAVSIQIMALIHCGQQNQPPCGQQNQPLCGQQNQQQEKLSVRVYLTLTAHL